MVRAAEPLTERERAIHALSRLAYGPRPGEVERVLALGVDRWVESQLAPAGIEDAAVERLLAGAPALAMTPAQLRAEFLEAERPENPTPEQRRELQRRKNEPRVQLLRSVLQRAVLSERQALEILTDLWRNHFNVSYTKGGPIEVFLPDWDRSVIRAHALGGFGALLAASAQHPAMLIYLDNAVSRRPATPAELAAIGRRVQRRTGSAERAEEEMELARQKGLNENYARELMELHTLGADNGYSQDDVVAVAEAFTGWTVRRNEGVFEFRNDMHVPGDKRVLGRVIPGDAADGAREGRAILELLAASAGTARFLARKLACRLIRDDPPPEAVEAGAAAYLESQGDIRALAGAIVASPAFWARDSFRAKFKTPFEFVVSALRATGAAVENPDAVLAALREMGQPIYLCDPPTGYADTAEAWLDPGVLAARWQFALDLAEGRIRGARVPPDFHADLQGVAPTDWWRRLAEKLLPAGCSESTQAALRAAGAEFLDAGPPGRRRQLAPRLLGLVLGSPEFQQQ
ncbi:MAG: DUF1800 domain-containing protein [Planctomycetota bacterium]|nr:MAG: DUF1800 domain-containing protein [Planctomycetota bacterium]